MVMIQWELMEPQKAAFQSLAIPAHMLISTFPHNGMMHHPELGG